MNLFNLPFSYLVLGVSYIVMAGYLLLKNPRKGLNVSGTLLGCAIAGWAFFSMAAVASKAMDAALMWTKLFLACVVFVPLFNLMFIRHFLLDTLKRGFGKKLLVVSGFLSLFFLISTRTPFLITRVSLRTGNFYFKDPGPLYHIFELYFFFIIVCCSWALLKALQASPRGSVQEKQTLTLLLTLIVSYLSGSTSYLLAHNQVHFSVVSIGNYLAIPYSIGVITAIRLSTGN